MSTTRRALALFLLTLGVLLHPAAAAAHSELMSATPADGSVLDAAPSEVVFTYTADVLGDFTQVVVTGPDGSPLEVPPPVTERNTVTQPLPDLVPGSYTVAFRIVSEDSHPIAGKTSFTIEGAEAATPSPATSVAQSPSPSEATNAPTDAATEAPTDAASPSPAASDGADDGGSGLSATVLLVLLALGLVALFTWLARSRARR